MWISDGEKGLGYSSGVSLSGPSETKLEARWEKTPLFCAKSTTKHSEMQSWAIYILQYRQLVTRGNKKYGSQTASEQKKKLPLMQRRGLQF